METITVTINGQEVLTKPGRTILDVVHDNNLDHIPTLCHDPRLEPYGSCFLCVVEVAGLKKLVPACSTLANEGMIIETDNDRIRSSRKTALELLLSNHYADCIGPCVNNCPANVDAQGYIALIEMGRYEEALKLVKQNNPLPLSIGRVCVRDCEVACRRQIVDESVAINHLKRYIADRDAAHMWTPEVPAPNGKTVAVVGGGPAGLTCAYYLTLKGYKVTIYEKLPELGGMLRYGIPEYRLPKAILDQEIHWILGLGVEVHTHMALGRDITIAGLRGKYDAVFLAVGAHRASTMRLEHEDETEGVMKGIDFLRQVELEDPPVFSGAVAVVGGGNTAIDAARTALRCGAEKVMIVYRRSIREMPAHEEEVEAARAEGVEFHFLTNPKSIARENGKLLGVECLKMSLQEVEGGGRPRPVPIPGSEFILKCGILIGAIGQQVDTDFNDGDNGCDLERWGTIRANEKTLETSIPGVFAGGDVVTGPWTAIGSIAQGKRAAMAIDRKIRSGKADSAEFHFHSFKHDFHDVTKGELVGDAVVAPRQKLPELPPKERICDFREVEQGYGDDQVDVETSRCLECGCVEYYDCKLRRYADDFGVDTTPFRGQTMDYTVDKSHPLLVNDPNKCISCGRCVRVCADVLGVAALGFVHRGFRSVVRPALEKNLSESPCISCGNCIDTCPTGALAEKFPHKVLGNLEKEDALSVCEFCSIGCAVNFKVLSPDHFHVANTTTESQAGPNRGFLCARGRFGHRYQVEGERFSNPWIRDGEDRKETTWETALTHTEKRLKEIIETHGTQSVAVFASPRWSNESQYLVQKLARAAIKTPWIGSFTRWESGNVNNEMEEQIGGIISTASLPDLEKADVIGILPGAMKEEILVLETMIRRARDRGTRVVVLGDTGPRMAALADLWVTPAAGSGFSLFYCALNEMLSSGGIGPHRPGGGIEGWERLTKHAAEFSRDKTVGQTGISSENLDQWMKLISGPEGRMVWVAPSERAGGTGTIPAMVDFMLATGRLHQEGSGWILIDPHANDAGARELGLNPSHLPGFVQESHSDAVRRIAGAWNADLSGAFSKDGIQQALKSGKIHAALVFGEDPLGCEQLKGKLNDLDFLLVMDYSPTPTTQQADVALPARSLAETEGNITRCDGRVQSLSPIVSENPDTRNWKIVSRLGSLFGEGFSHGKVTDVVAEIQSLHDMLSKSRGEGFRGASLLLNGPLNGGSFRFACVSGGRPAGKPAPDVIATERYFRERIRTE